ncbi:MAG TPA: MarR family transcriptional regulator [Bacteroidales bacterium]|nr:MarR family transcriptional regulator [Bacteroidales bacterium]
MENELQYLIDQFLKILNLYAVLGRKPKDYGSGDLLYLTEVHTIATVGKNEKVNMTTLAEIMGVTRGAISQTIRKLVVKGLIIKSNSHNLKEFNLMLSRKGRVVYRGLGKHQKEIFAFAEPLYMSAKKEDRQLVRRLFDDISGNLEQRVRQS